MNYLQRVAVAGSRTAVPYRAPVSARLYDAAASAPNAAGGTELPALDALADAPAPASSAGADQSGRAPRRYRPPCTRRPAHERPRR